MPLQLLEELDDIHELMERRQWAEAREALWSITRRYPTRVEALELLVNACYELDDMVGYQHACERLLAVRRNNADATLGLAGAYLANVRPALARRTFRRFLERWPEHPRAADARAELERLEPILAEMLASVGLADLEREEAAGLAALHEESQVLLEQGQYAPARRLAEQLLRQRPTFVAALNNLSQLEALEGRFDHAIEAAQRVLAAEPENVHALSNLTRYLCLTGRLEDAGRLAQRLMAVQAQSVDAWTKKAEALSYLGHDEGVLACLRGAEASGASGEPAVPAGSDALLLHLAAVATLRRGGSQAAREARRLWDRALKGAPGLDVARDNLDDLARPEGVRNGPWAFGLRNWVPETRLRSLAAVTRVAAQGDQAIAQATRRALEEPPPLALLVPLLLDRGDPEGREFAVNMAAAARTPELLAALRDFALGQRGSDALRQRAAQAAVGAGLLPSGAVRLWLQGEWRETLLFDFEVHGEPIKRNRPARLQRLLGQAIEALRDEEAERAIPLLERVLAEDPDAPDALNNLAVAYEAQGRRREAHAIIERNYERNPDYLFARTGMAHLRAQEGRHDEAKALLDPLLARRRFHFDEFGAMCSTWIHLFLAKKERDAARSWLSIWERIDPEHPQIDVWRERIDPLASAAALVQLDRLLGGLSGLGRQGSR